MRLLRDLVLALLLCLSLPAFAEIRLETRPSVRVRGDQVDVRLGLTNHGDEAAHDLEISVQCATLSTVLPSVAHLDSGADWKGTARLDGLPGRGNFPVWITIRYRDANGYPFGAGAFVSLMTEPPEPNRPSVDMELSELSLIKDGVLTLSARSQGAPTLDARIQLLLPPGVVCEKSTRAARLIEGESQTWTFDVRADGARAGSRYPIYATVEYDVDGVHAHHAALSHVDVRRAPVPDYARASLAIPLFFLLLLAMDMLWLHRLSVSARHKAVCWACLVSWLAFFAAHFSPSLLFSDTMAIGGDTPAHLYLSSHLKHELFTNGRIVSWADGWWCGFPMYQFYFSLPYLAVSLLSCVMPLTVAFKIVSISGILSLPLAAWVSARWMKLPRPIPLVMAIVMIPFLFVRAHTMWGVNIYSTLAGMIANSISFSILLLYLGAAVRDAMEGRFRFSTVALLVMVMASHFFTTIMAVLVVAILPLAVVREKRLPAFKILVGGGLLATGLMSWWLVPLLAKIQYSVDFGGSWPLAQVLEMTVTRGTLDHLLILGLPAIAGLVLAIRSGSRIAWVFLWMAIVAAGLFFFGSQIADVFNNIRLWPFLFYALTALCGLGLGWLLTRTREADLYVLCLLVLAMVYVTLPRHAPEGEGVEGWREYNQIRGWSDFNYGGVEALDDWPVYKELVLDLEGTPGRLANDLIEDNNRLGSTRIFESVPYRIGKPILEGGIVNSAAGSFYSYYIQGETSQNSAGYPNLVTPATFDMERGSAHLEFFNVKHFIARWPRTQAAFSKSDRWERLKESRGWELYENTAHDGSYVTIAETFPVEVVVSTSSWKEVSMAWMYAFDFLDQGFVIQDPCDPPSSRSFWHTVTEPEFYDLLAAGRTHWNPRQVNAGRYSVSEEEVTSSRITFRTNGLGLPHLIKMSYYPNWKVLGADRIYRVSPDFMLVYPSQEEVTLYFGYTLSDNIGRSMSLLTTLCVLGLFVRRICTKTQHEASIHT